MKEDVARGQEGQRWGSGAAECGGDLTALSAREQGRRWGFSAAESASAGYISPGLGHPLPGPGSPESPTAVR
jgi:hypothetical protein